MGIEFTLYMPKKSGFTPYVLENTGNTKILCWWAAGRKIIKPGKLNKCRISSRATQCRVLVKVVLLRVGRSFPVLYLYSWDIAKGGWQVHCKNLYTARQLCTVGCEQRKEEQFAGRTLLFGLWRRLFDQRRVKKTQSNGRRSSLAAFYP